MILLVLVSIALMTADHRQHLGEPLRTAVETAAHPIHLAVNLPFALGSSAMSTEASTS